METNPEKHDSIINDTKAVNEKLSPTGIVSMKGDETKVPSDWIDRGVVDVSVADLPNPEGVSSPDDFDHHISWEDAQIATKKLPEIQTQVNAGKAGDDFTESDSANGLDYSQGNRRVYDLYYGSDPVTLDKVGSEYTIISGRHRVFAAKEAGLKSMPARIREKIS